MLKGKDQTFARDNNMKAVLQLLFNEEISCSELADKCGLSKPAVTKITTEMFALKLITQGSRSDEGAKAALGRKRVYLSVNPDFGVIAAIDFSTVAVKIHVCNMRGEVLARRLIADSEFLTLQILENVASELKSMLSEPDICGKELLACCVAASGMVDKASGKVVQSTKFKACPGIDLRQFFTDRLGGYVEVQNDVNLALLGEQMYGNTQNFSEAFMVYVDSGIGGALMVNGKIVGGEHGFAGEFGLIKVHTNKGYRVLDALCSINAMKDIIREKGKPAYFPERFHFSDVVDAYKNGDKLVSRVVNDSAAILSQEINNLSIALDGANAIICGRVRELGQPYLDALRENAPDCNINFNRLYDDGVIGGAIHAAWNTAVDIMIDRR